MAFIVPTLQPHLYGRFHFGACKLAAAITDPGGAPASGVVQLRGAVSPDAMYQLTPPDPTNLITLCTLPAGLRPRDPRWLTCQVTSYLGMYAATPRLCAILANGDVRVQLPAGSLSVDGAVFFDGLSFFAESIAKPAPVARRKARKAR